MTDRTSAAMTVLAAADPCKTVNLEALCPSLDTIDLTSNTAHARTQLASRRHAKLFRPRLLVAAAVVCALLIGGVVGWPWTNPSTGPVAYGVTVKQDGLVTVRIARQSGYDPRLLQQQLDAAGVRAVVMVQSPTGRCPLPMPEGLPDNPPVFDYPQDTNSAEESLFDLHPDALPANATILIQVSFAGEPGIDKPGFPMIGQIVRHVPACVPQSSFGPGDPIPTGLYNTVDPSTAPPTR